MFRISIFEFRIWVAGTARLSDYLFIVGYDYFRDASAAIGLGVDESRNRNALYLESLVELVEEIVVRIGVLWIRVAEH